MDLLDRFIPKVGERIGRYEIVQELGRGGFGVVYKARQSGLDADVAIKVLIPHMSEQAQTMQLLERFEQEARVIKQLEHPAALKVRDYGRTPEGLPYLVTEFVRGKTLEDVLADDGPLAPARIARIARQVLSCLAEAHHRGIVHRDLKPANIMLRDIFGEQDAVKVLDFGIAKVSDQSGVKTMTGMRFGTPWYMAPEQCRGETDLDGRLDLYALGLIMAECLTASRVVAVTDMMAAFYAQANRDPLELEAAVVESPLFPIILMAIQKERDQRYPDALRMREALDGLGVTMSGELAIGVGSGVGSALHTPQTPPPNWPSQAAGGGSSAPVVPPTLKTPRPESGPLAPEPSDRPKPSAPRRPSAQPEPGPESSAQMIGPSVVRSRVPVIAALALLAAAALGAWVILSSSSDDVPDTASSTAESQAAAAAEWPPLEVTTPDVAPAAEQLAGTAQPPGLELAPTELLREAMTVGQLREVCSAVDCPALFGNGLRTLGAQREVVGDREVEAVHYCRYDPSQVPEDALSAAFVDAQPMNCLSRAGASAYCEHLGSRLPTAEEAASLGAVDGNIWSWTSTPSPDDPDKMLVFGGPDWLEGPEPVTGYASLRQVRATATPAFMGVTCLSGGSGREADANLVGHSSSETPAEVIGEVSPTRQEIARVMSAHRSAMTHCYQQGLRSNPELSGRVVLSFTIRATEGRVTEVSVAESSLAASEVESCLVRRVRGLVFPQGPAPRLVHVNYPLVFESN